VEKLAAPLGDAFRGIGRSTFRRDRRGFSEVLPSAERAQTWNARSRSITPFTATGRRNAAATFGTFASSPADGTDSGGTRRSVAWLQ